MNSFFVIFLVLTVALLLMALLSWLAYLLIYFPTAWWIPPGRLRIARLVLSPLLVIFVFAVYFGTHGPRNDDTATIESMEEGYKLTLTGRRVYMVHDLFSLVKMSTYPDSAVWIIPRASGTVEGNELRGRFGSKPSGSIRIDRNEISVDLYFYSTDTNSMEPLDWNGNYSLKRKP